MPPSLEGATPPILGGATPPMLGGNTPPTLGGNSPSTLGSAMPPKLGGNAPSILGGDTPPPGDEDTRDLLNNLEQIRPLSELDPREENVRRGEAAVDVEKAILDEAKPERVVKIGAGLPMVIKGQIKAFLQETLAIQEEVQKLLDTGIITEAYYPNWLANVVRVKKANGKWRMCIDYTDSNVAQLKKYCK